VIVEKAAEEDATAKDVATAAKEAIEKRE